VNKQSIFATILRKHARGKTSLHKWEAEHSGINISALKCE